MNQVKAPNLQHYEASMAVFSYAELDASNRSRVFKGLGSLAISVVAGDENNQLPGFSHDDLRYFDAQRSPQEKKAVEYREGLLRGFEPFDKETERIKAELETKPAKDIEGFLASGSESDVFVIENGGKQYALRISKANDDKGAYDRAEHIDFSYLKGAFRAAHIDGMEKLVGVSYEKGATIGEIIPGKPMAEYSAEEIADIPKEHYKKLAMTVVRAAQAGISLDGNEGNLLYDAELGFGFVDFNVSVIENRGLAQPTTASVFGTDKWLPKGEIPASEYEADYVVLRNVLAATIPTYDKWIETLIEVQEQMGLSPDYLTRIEELRQTSANMKAALQELASDGEKDLNTRMQTPDRIFPKGSVRPTRNDYK
jgi:hypothetical protein